MSIQSLKLYPVLLFLLIALPFEVAMAQCTGSGIAIPASGNAVSGSINVTVDPLSQVVSVCMIIDHPDVSDLTVELLAPGGVIPLKLMYDELDLSYSGQIGEDLGNPGTNGYFCFTTAGTDLTYYNGGAGYPGGCHFAPAIDYNSLFSVPGYDPNGSWSLNVTNFGSEPGTLVDWSLGFDDTTAACAADLCPNDTGNQTFDPPPINGTAFVCYDGEVTLSTDPAGYLIPTPVDPSGQNNIIGGLTYAIFNCPPGVPYASAADFATDPCFNTILPFDESGGLPPQDFFQNTNATGMNDYNSTPVFYLLPIMSDNYIAFASPNPNPIPTAVPTTNLEQFIDGNGDGCIVTGSPTQIRFLEEFTATVEPGCDGVQITLEGGLPGFDDTASYTWTNNGPGNETNGTASAPDFNFTITGVSTGAALNITIEDPNGCSITVTDAAGDLVNTPLANWTPADLCIDETAGDLSSWPDQPVPSMPAGAIAEWTSTPAGLVTGSTIDLSTLPAGTTSIDLTYTVTHAPCPPVSITQPVNISPLPDPTLLPGPIQLCAQSGNYQLTQLIDQANGGEVGGTWESTDEPAFSLLGFTLNTNSVPTPVTPGNSYTFTYTVTGTTPCADASAEIEIEFLDPPEIDLLSPGISVCSTETNLDLTELFDPAGTNTPGGTWSSSDLLVNSLISAGTLDISQISGITSVPITYTVGDAADPCGEVEETSAIEIEEQPVITGSNGDACSTDTAFDLESLLDAGFPVGGTWTTSSTEAIITGTTIDVTAVTSPPVGVTYEALLPPGSNCQPASGTFNIALATGLDPSWTTDDLCSTNPVNLDINFGVTGGTWSSADPVVDALISGADFDVPGLPGGTSSVDLIYTVPENLPCQEASLEQTVNVITVGNAEWQSDPVLEFCNDGPSVNMNDYLLDPTQTGGTWSSFDLSITDDGIVDLSTGNTAGPGFNIIRYEIPGIGACSGDFDEHQIIIFAASDASWTPPASICVGEIVTLNDLLDDPANTGGTWTTSEGTISGGNLDIAGLDPMPASVDLTYTVAATTPCTEAISTQSISIIPDGDASWIAADVCVDPADSVYDLNQMLEPSATSGGTWTAIETVSISATGELDLSSLPDPPTLNLTYTVPGQNLCPDVVSIEQEVNFPTQPDTNWDNSVTVCSGDDAFNLDDLLPGAADANGVWSSPDAIVTGNELDATSILDPSSGSIEVTYNIPADLPCLDSPTTLSLPVAPGVVPAWIPPAVLCSNITDFNLDDLLDPGVSTPGGTWTATGSAVISGSTLDVSTVSGNSVELTYTVDGIGTCPGDALSQTVAVSPAPTATLSGDYTFCGEVDEPVLLDLVFTGNGPFNVTLVDDIGTPFSFANVIDGQVEISPAPTSSTSFFISALTDSSVPPCDALSLDGVATVAINENPAFDSSSVVEQCISETELTVSFAINAGLAPFTVTSGNGSVSAGIFNSDPIASGAPYEVTIEDVNGCPLVFNSLFNCACEGSVGIMPPGPEVFCGPETDILFSSTAVTDADDILAYYLHDSPTASLGNVLAVYVDDVGLFSFDENTMEYGASYYVSPAIGNDLNGEPDPDDPCYAIAAGTEIIFYEEPQSDAGPDDFVCGLTYDLQAVAPVVGIGTWTVDGLPTGLETANFASGNDPATSVTVDGLGTYTFTWTVENGSPDCDASSSVDITFEEQATFVIVSEACADDFETYTVSFDLIGLASSGVVITDIDGTDVTSDLVGNQFTSGPITAGESYSFAIEDGTSCEEFLVTGDLECTPDCPTLDSVSSDLDHCSGEALQLVLELTDNSLSTITWTDPEGNESQGNSLDLTALSIDACQEVLTFAYSAICNADNTNEISGEVNVTVYPQPSGSPVNDGSCAVTLEAACPELSVSYEITSGDGLGDTGSGDTFDLAVAGESGIVQFTVVNPGAPAGCDGEQTYDLNFLCPDLVCSEFDGLQNVGSEICSGEQPQIDDGAIIDNDYTGGIVAWYYDQDPSFDPYTGGSEYLANPLPENLTCDAVNYTFKARLDGIPDCTLSTSGFPVTVYPNAQDFVESSVDGDCTTGPSVQLLSADGTVCDEVSEPAPDNPACGSADPNTAEASLTVTVFSGTTCEQSFDFSATASCASVPCTACPSTTASSTTAETCGEISPTMPVLPLDEDNGGTVEWFEGDPTAGGIPLSSIDFTNETCEGFEIILSAWILCDADEDPNTADIYQDLAYTHTLMVYPEQLTVTTTDGGCGVAANVLITALDGTVCQDINSAVPANPPCGPAGSNTETAIYAETIFSGTCTLVFDEQATATCDAVPCTPCPTTIEPAFAPIEICSGEIPVLTDPILADDNGNPVEWFLGDSETGTPFADVVYENQGCNYIEFLFNAFVLCDDDLDDTTAEIYQDLAFSQIVRLYPDDFTVSATAGDCVIAPSILIEAADGSQCSQVSGVVPEEPDCGLPANETTVTDPTIFFEGSACERVYADLAIASCASEPCEILCPSSSDLPPSGEFCSSDVVIPPVLSLDDPNLNSVEWFEGDAATGTPLADIPTINETCDPIDHVVNAFILCDQDGDPGTAEEYIDLSVSYQFSIYPAQFTTEVLPGSCGVAGTINVLAVDATVCDTESTAVPANPACDSGLTNDETITFENDYFDTSSCGFSLVVEVPALCADQPCTSCPSTTDVPTNEELCSGGTINPPTLVLLNDNGNSVEWFLGDADTGAALATIPTINQSCDPVPLALSAWILCDHDEDDTTAEIYQDLLFTHTVTLYPDTYVPIATQEGSCGTQAILTIQSADGQECEVLPGEVPVEPDCGTGLNDNRPINFNQDYFIGTACEFNVAITIAADCEAPDCDACPSTSDGNGTLELCSGDAIQPPVVTLQDDNGESVQWYQGDPLTGVPAADLPTLNEGCSEIILTINAFIDCATETEPVDLGLAVEITIYPAPFTFEGTEGGCGIAPSWVLNAADGSLCESDTGLVPTNPACGTADPNVESLDGPGVFFAGTSCEQTFDEVVLAQCDPIDCTLCPTTSDAPDSEEICSGGTPVIPELTLIDDNLNTVEWFVGDPATGQAFTDVQFENNSCEPITVSLSAWILCDDDDDDTSPEIYQDLAYTYSVTVYPEQFDFVAVPGDCENGASWQLFAFDGTECDTSVGATPQEPDCDMTTEVFLDPPGILFQGTTCEQVFEQPVPATCVGDACPIDCPTTSSTPDAEDVCSGDLPSLPQLTLDIVTGNLVEWFVGDPTTGTPFSDLDFINETCDPEVIVLNAFILCDDDADPGTADVYHDLAYAYSIQLFPAPFTYATSTGACGLAASWTLTSVDGATCASDQSAIPANPLCDSGETNTETLVAPGLYFDGSPCSQLFFDDVEASCTATDCTACPSTTDVPVSQNVCTGDVPSLPVLSLVDENGEAVEWFEGDPLTGTALADLDLTNETCDFRSITLSAFILCDDDEDDSTPLIYHDLTYTFVLNLYPEPLSFVPTPGSCNQAAEWTLTAVDGTLCDSSVGDAPAEPDCDSGTTNSSPLAGPGILFAGSGCEQDFDLEVAADCDAIACTDCPTTTSTPINEELCSGSVPIPPTLVLVDDNSNPVEWFIDDPLTGTAVADQDFANLGCDAIDFSLSAYILCDHDADPDTPEEYHDLQFTYTVSVYPASFDFIPVSGTCALPASYTLLSADGTLCASDNSLIPIQPDCGTGAINTESLNGPGVFFIGTICEQDFSDVTTAECAAVDCTTCPSTNDPDGSEAICSGGVPALPTPTLQNDNLNSVVWYEGDPVTGTLWSDLNYQNTDCGLVTIVLSAYISCDDDEDPGTPEIWQDLALTHTVEIFPAMTLIPTFDDCDAGVAGPWVTCALGSLSWEVTAGDNLGASGTGDLYDQAVEGDLGIVTFTLVQQAAIDAGLDCGVFEIEVPIDCPSLCQVDASTIAPAAICEDEQLDLSTLVVGDAGGQWSTNAPPGSLGGNIFFGNDQGGQSFDLNYTVTTGPDCIDITTQTIQVLETPVVIAGDGGDLCSNETINLSGFADGADSVFWSGGQGQFSSPANESTSYTPAITESGAVYLYLTASAFCGTQVDSVLLNITPAVPINVPATITIDQGDSVPINISGGSGSFVWSDPDNTLSCTDCPNPTAQPIATTIYNVLSLDGCTEASLTIIVNQPPSFTFPNAFSPNGDGVNEVFRALQNDVVEMELFIYDRWGKLLYSTDNVLEGWDGSYEGEPVDIGVYVYYARYKYDDEVARFHKGNVTVVR